MSALVSTHGRNGRAVEAPAADPVMLDARSFNRMICLERKRTERAPRLFLLMLLDVAKLIADDRKGKALARILHALSGSIRETDVVGWHTEGSVVGIIFTEIPTGLRDSIVSTMLLRVRGVLYSKLQFEQFSQISISHHLFPEEWSHDVPQRPSHPTLYPDLTETRKGGKAFSISKRAMDIVGSSLGLLVASPFFLALAGAVKLSSKGPVLFRQVRVGQFGEPFVFLKFRSMYLRDRMAEAGEQQGARTHRHDAEADRLAADPAGVVYPARAPGLADPHGGGLGDADRQHEREGRALQRDRMGRESGRAEAADDQSGSGEEGRLDAVAQPDRQAEPKRLAEGGRDQVSRRGRRVKSGN